MTSNLATFIGTGALAIWSFSALLAEYSGPFPPFQTTALTFGISTLVVWSLGSKPDPQEPPFMRRRAIWTGYVGTFVFNALYFTGVRTAPVVEASLINMLWPLLLVVFSGLLPGQRLKARAVLGALIGFAGCAVLTTRGGSISFQTEYLPGYLAALGSALTWAGYSLYTAGRITLKPWHLKYAFLLCTLSAAAVHLVFEETALPGGFLPWGALVLLGFGSKCACYFLWNAGMKGRIQLLGVLSYFLPVVSTLVLIGFKEAPAHWSVVAAAGMVSGGAMMAALPIKRKKRAASS